MRTRRLVEELRRENDRRDGESAERIEAIRADSRRYQERIDASIVESREEHRKMIAELRDHGQRMRVGFETLFGAFADLRHDLQSWRDEGGSGAA